MEMRATRNNEPGAHRDDCAEERVESERKKNTRTQHPYTCRKNNIILFWPPPSLPPPLARSLILSRILLTRAHTSPHIYIHAYIIYTYTQDGIYIHTYNLRVCVLVCVYT